MIRPLVNHCLLMLVLEQTSELTIHFTSFALLSNSTYTVQSYLDYYNILLWRSQMNRRCVEPPHSGQIIALSYQFPGLSGATNVNWR